jgi:hypothetical protein
VLAHVTGIEVGQPVAVSVNGRVRATARVVEEGGARRVSAMIPEEALAAGANRIELWAAGESGDRLERIPAR